MKRLLYITTNLQGSGGISSVLSVKLNYLLNHFTCDIHIITTNNKSKTFFYDFHQDIKFHTNPVKTITPLTYPKYRSHIKRKIEEIDPDVIVNCGNGLKGALLPYFVTNRVMFYEMHREKSMTHEHNFELLKIKLCNILLKKSISKYYKFIVLNKTHKNEWSGSNVMIIHNPVSIPMVKPTKMNSEKVIAVGRFTKVKGYIRLFNIWKAILHRYPTWILEVYGEGDKKEYNRELEKLNIVDSVVLNDAIKDITIKYSEASILLNTSISESFGMSIIEAMSFGLPVIAFKTHGSTEIIENGVNGFIVEQDDIDGYVTVFDTLVQDNFKWKSVSKEAKRSVLKYDLEMIMHQWAQLFGLSS